MKTYGQYCPVAKAAEILGDRWTMLIVRDILYGPVGFVICNGSAWSSTPRTRAVTG
ncbi:MAG TPA: hypothetical protein VF163_08985 [Micromonosporaceae bacterium]